MLGISSEIVGDKIVGDRPRETLVNGAFHGVERLR